MTQKEQEEYIRENYLEIPIKALAIDVGRSQTFVRGFMNRNGLKIPKALAMKRKKANQFRKGNVSHNKGRKQEEFMSTESIERTKATRFKKGNLPHNTKEDGCVSLRNSKGRPYWWVRVGLNKWNLLHREVWKSVYGSIPKGHNVQFKDGDTTNVSIDNLYLVDRKTQIRINQNGGNALPLELQKTIELTYKIMAKTKTYEKQDH